MPELGVGSIPLWHAAVGELDFEFTQLLKVFAPNACQISLACPPIETNTLERSNALLCHGAWLSFFIELVECALSRNPLPELGIGKIPEWHAAVTELDLVFTQFLEVVAPLRVSNSSIISSFKSRCIETWLVLVLALAISNALSFWLAFRRSYP